MFEPERLRLARERRGYNKSGLARLAGLTPATIASYERGATEPSDRILADLSQALAFPSGFFHKAMPDPLPTDSASFRALSRMTASQRGSALAAGTLATLLNAWIEDRFELPAPDVAELDPTVIDPEGAAAAVRAAWGLGEQPVPNVLHLLEAHGVRVYSLVEECREVDAFSFWHRTTPFVCLNTHKTAERSTFDLAHELAHLVLHRGHAAPRGRQEETQANQFASSFLMPRADVAATVSPSPDLHELTIVKHRWKVSAAALNYRVHDIGMMSDWHYRETCIEISRLGRALEPNPLPREQSQVLQKVFSKLRREGISRRSIAHDLELHPRDVDALTFGLAVSAVQGHGQGRSTSTASLSVVT